MLFWSRAFFSFRRGSELSSYSFKKFYEVGSTTACEHLEVMSCIYLLSTIDNKIIFFLIQFCKTFLVSMYVVLDKVNNMHVTPLIPLK